MELTMEFATFCNICFNKKCLRKIEENEHILNTLMLFIENKIVIKNQDVYLCLKCCEKLESYDQFKEMCLVNFADFRIEYSKLKNKLETSNDVNMEKKLRNFIETKIYGTSDSVVDYSADTIKLPHHDSGKNSTEKQNEINDNSYDFHSVRCKAEKTECEENNEYKLHTDLDLKTSDDEFELPVPVEHIKMESYVEDIDATESTSNNKLIESSKFTEHRSDSTSVEDTYKEKKRYSCSVCDKTYTKVSNLKAHEGTHTGEMPHRCNICNKAFGLPDRLKEHMFLHSNEQPYTCLVCNKNFKTLRYLKRHKVFHADEKPYACSKCDKTFNSSKNLKMHELVHTGEKPYTCEVCQKSFRLISCLNVHKRIHTGEKPYECPVCKMRFTQLRSCKIHQLTHTGEKPHSCSICKKTFRELNTMKDHERLHTGDRPYNCDICNKSFIRRDQLRKHKKKPCVVLENK